MEFEWTDNQRRCCALFREFGEMELAPTAEARDQGRTFDHDLWHSLADAGLWRLDVPEEFGGDGGTLWEFLAGFEGLASGAGDLGFLLTAIAHAGLIQVLLDHGSHEQQAAHLPRLVSGAVGATAATEPTGGSHVVAVTTSAREVDGGYLLDGHKTYITNAPVADLLLIVGRIPSLGRRDITLFLVDPRTEGVELGRPEDLMGTRSSPAGPIILEQVHLTDDDIVGRPGDGLAVLYSFLAFDRLMYSVAVAGFLEPLLQRAISWSQEREAFGVPLAEHEYVQDKIVVTKMTIETSRWLAYSAAAALERRDRSASLQASLAKLAASEGTVRAALELVQVFGHRGYQRGFGLERALRDAVALRIAGGTSEMQKRNVFKQLLTTDSAAPEYVGVGAATVGSWR
jgi:isovaleryl-CoA dehydrogenase